MDKLPNKNGFRLSAKESLGTLAGTALALGSMKTDDPFVVVPMLILAGIAFVVMCILHSGNRHYRASVAIAIVLVLAFIGWRDLRVPTQAAPKEESKTTQSPSQSQVVRSNPTTLSQPPANVPPASHGRSTEIRQKAAEPNEGIMVGKDSVAMGDIPKGLRIGDRSVFVGPTGSHGNTILNKGGIAVGNGARADSTSIAIGAGANAGGGAPQNIYAPGGIAIGGGIVTNPTVNNFGPPPPQPLVLSEKQQAALHDAFEDSMGGPVKIMVDKPSSETMLFASNLRSALSITGLEPPEIDSAVIFVPAPGCQSRPGVWMIVGSNRLDTANSIAAALGKSGVVQGKVSGCMDRNDPNRLMIVVSRN